MEAIIYLINKTWVWFGPLLVVCIFLVNVKVIMGMARDFRREFTERSNDHD